MKILLGPAASCGHGVSLPLSGPQATPAEAPPGTLGYILFGVRAETPRRGRSARPRVNSLVHTSRLSGQRVCASPSQVAGLWPVHRVERAGLPRPTHRTASPSPWRPVFPICQSDRTEPDLLLRISVLPFAVNLGLSPRPVWSLL